MSKKEKDKERYIRNRDVFIERARLWKLKNPERALELRHRQEKKQRETGEYQRILDCKSNKQRRIKIRVLEHYAGGVPTCECCDEWRIEFLSLDHINGNGAAHRREVGKNVYKWIERKKFPENMFRVLCMNCNTSRGNYGYCPHDD